MNKMLINATQQEELRVALVKDDKLDDLYIERLGSKQKKANIYKGKVTRVEPSLGAAFVDYGAERHGFLPLKEIAKSYFQTNPKETDPEAKIEIKDVLKSGQELIVQIEKEERGNKGAALTTFTSLAGAYLVLMPNNPRSGGISRRIEGQERDDLRVILTQLKAPEGMSVIVRTAGVGKSVEELQWDLGSLVSYWQAILEASQERKAPFLIHEEGDVIIRAMRDHLRQDMEQILIDSPEIYERIKAYVQQTRPNFLDKIELYADKIPLFSRYHLEKQIETVYQRTVNLISGGSIVIDHTEALVSIDVNSAKATSGAGIEETALNTNVEAADEISRQLRLRDIGGLIVIDFIDMVSNQNQRQVTTHLRNALKQDRARIRTGNITRFGLMEMSRQRLHPRLGESTQVTCSRCDGQGAIRSIHSLALSIIRLLEEAAMENTAQIQAQLPTDLATYLLNEKHHEITAIEQRHNIKILIIPNQHIQTPNYHIKRLKASDLPKNARSISSYKLIETPEMETPRNVEIKATKKIEVPAVTAMVRKKPAPKKNGLIKKLLSLFKKPAPVKNTKPPARKKYYSNKPRQQYRQSNRPNTQSQSRSSNARRGSRGGRPKGPAAS